MISFLKPAKHKVIHKYWNVEPDVLRTNGNEFFRQGDYVRAIALYTKSASVAAADSRPRGLALANRSAVLLALGLYQECLKDVEAAFRCGYPEDLAHKLHLRSAVCHKALGDADKAQKSFQKVLQEFNLPLDKREKVAEDANRQFKEVHVPKVPRIRVQYLNPPELSYGAQQENPALSAGVRKRPNPTLGHVYVAERDLSIGDVILVENPMMYGLTFDYYDSEEKYWTYCHECFKFCLNLTPCPSCSWSLYCSKMCRAEALQKHHRVECGVKQSAIDGILRKQKKQIKTSVLIAVDHLFKVISFLGLQNCITALSDDDKHQVLETASESIKKIFAVKKVKIGYRRVKDFDESFVVDQVVASFKLSPKETKRLATFLTEISSILERYKFCILECVISQNGDHYDCLDHNQHAWGFFATATKFNYCCDPNTIQCFHGKTMVLKLLRPIRCGEEIFLQADLDYRFFPLADRQMVNKFNSYECQCDACIFDWPRSDDQKMGADFVHNDLNCMLLALKLSKHIESVDGAYRRNFESDEIFRVCVSITNEYSERHHRRDDQLYGQAAMYIFLYLQSRSKKFVFGERAAGQQDDETRHYVSIPESLNIFHTDNTRYGPWSCVGWPLMIERPAC